MCGLPPKGYPHGGAPLGARAVALLAPGGGCRTPTQSPSRVHAFGGSTLHRLRATGARAWQCPILWRNTPTCATSSWHVADFSSAIDIYHLTANRTSHNIFENFENLTSRNLRKLHLKNIFRFFHRLNMGNVSPARALVLKFSEVCHPIGLVEAHGQSLLPKYQGRSFV